MNGAQPDADDSRSLRATVGAAAGVFLGGVLLLAAWSKMIDPAAFMELVTLEGLDFALPSWIVAPIGLALEAGLGLALLLNMRRLWVLVPAAVLCLFFVYLTTRSYIAYLGGDLDPAQSCGCFGNLVERTPAQAFWWDLLLLVPPLCLAFLGFQRGGPLPRVRMEIVGVTVLMALGFAWKAPDLALDDMATRLYAGVELESLCVGEGESLTCLDDLAPELSEGRHLLVIADTNQRAFRYAVPHLSELVLSDAGVGLLVLTAANLDEIKEFQWELGPTFEVRHAPAELLRPLYRRTPRTALIENGRVVRTYDGLPPVDAFAPLPADEDQDEETVPNGG